MSHHDTGLTVARSHLYQRCNTGTQQNYSQIPDLNSHYVYLTDKHISLPKPTDPAAEVGTSRGICPEGTFHATVYLLEVHGTAEDKGVTATNLAPVPPFPDHV